METPAAAMIASIARRNISGSSRSTQRLAMNAPDIGDAVPVTVIEGRTLS